ncbi:G-protein coupled receptor 157-like [Mizuhopecten yessoensis]|uniref:G-protein coupled receptor 157 n=1 Tax=Mizuhopecten yessoensis TaxID=6573 RepID=A0A210PNU5_MIZYE|nr:G-protein coupled receptor 157-like [Mizuhopecten yessoensis]OWF38179.1 G-protein coupled receptor 157 [Mizuhopecten yessoensis]
MIEINLNNITAYFTLNNTYIAVGLLTSCMSLCGCALILGTYIGFQSLRATGRKILVYITICNMGACVGHIIGAATIIGYDEKTAFVSFTPCAVSSAFTICFRLGSYLWTCALGLFLCVSMSWKRIQFGKTLMGPFHLVCWSIPIGITIAVLVSDVVGFDSQPLTNQNRPPWCWIDHQAPDYVTWAFLTGPGWQMGAIVVCACAYTVLQWHSMVKKPPLAEDVGESTENLFSLLTSANSRLRQVLVVFILLQVWGTWSFLVSLHRPSPIWLVLLQEIGNHSQGLANAIIFCVYTGAVRHKLAPKFQACCCCCCRRCPINCKKSTIRIPVEMAALGPQGPEGEGLMVSTAEDEID